MKMDKFGALVAGDASDNIEHAPLEEYASAWQASIRSSLFPTCLEGLRSLQHPGARSH